ncbi:tetratricopeptide repeat-containing glycosyltransferase family protein [Candidatus Dependentiae bacterium]|nr:tetratricopeptide repeat-containing glycosyltransferase family protein [Candidatus Dependentiae bacterium]
MQPKSHYSMTLLLYMSTTIFSMDIPTTMPFLLNETSLSRSSLAQRFIRDGRREQRGGNYEQALEKLHLALLADPYAIDSWHRCGEIALKIDRPHDAITYLEYAITIDPNHTQALFALANAYHEIGNLTKAISLYQQLYDQHPNHPVIIYNYAYVLKKHDQVSQAIPHYLKSLALKPDYAEAHFGLSLAYLTLGDFKNGWREYEWRWAAYREQPKIFHQPVWDGSEINGKRIFVYAEQGLGDTFQFMRYLKLLKDRGAYVIFQTQKPLKTLLTLCPYIDVLITEDSEIPPFDTYCALMSLPYAFGTHLETVPAEIPYLYAREPLVNHWKEYLASDNAIKIGICWQGNASYTNQALRRVVAAKSLPVTTLAPLAQVPGVHFYSLQKINGEEQLAQLPQDFQVTTFDNIDEEHGRFMDTAAIIKNLDLVITVDTSIAHCAAALGTPVWILLPKPADWRWMLERTDTPWYPTMRLFKQKEPGNWQRVIDDVQQALKEFVAHKKEQQ